MAMMIYTFYECKNLKDLIFKIIIYIIQLHSFDQGSSLIQ